MFNQEHDKPSSKENWWSKFRPAFANQRRRFGYRRVMVSRSCAPASRYRPKSPTLPAILGRAAGFKLQQGISHPTSYCVPQDGL
jgi:hypothetical protein